MTTINDIAGSKVMRIHSNTRITNINDISVHTAELLAALDAVPRALLGEKVQTFYSGNAEANRLRGELSKADREIESARKAARDESARAEAAEAKLARVREVAHEFYKVRGDWASVWGGTALKDKLTEALADAPAFVLPTTVPAKVEAVGLIGSQEPHTFTLWSDGETLIWHSDFGTRYVPEMLMEAFKNHRILEDGE